MISVFTTLMEDKNPQISYDLKSFHINGITEI